MRSFIVVFAALTGCGDTTNGNSLPTVTDYEHAAVNALCQFFQRCGQVSPSQGSNCQGMYTSTFTGPMAYSLDEAISAGRVSFDGVAAKSCVDLFASADCDFTHFITIGQSAACRGVVKGLVPAGGACKSSSECANGYCDQGAGSAPGCPGTCTAFVATGAACTSSLRCATTDYCSTTTNVCTTLGAQGAACTTISQCTTQLSCRDLTCQPPGGEGAGCSQASFACDTGLYCDTSTQPVVCKRRQPQGAVCISGNSCSDGLICVRTTGANSGTCQPFADVGQSCTTLGCAGDSVCDPATTTCKLKAQPGEDCSTVSCGLNLYCNTAKKCAQRIPFGGACDPTTPSPCIDGTCSTTTMTCALVCS